MARCIRPMALCLLVVCAASVVALAQEGGPAEVMPGTAVLYVEAGSQTVTELLGAVSLPPVAGLVPGAPRSRFGHFDHLLSLAPGTAERLAPHLVRAAFGVDETGPLFVLQFDDEEWPGVAVQGAPQDDMGLRELAHGVCAVARGRYLALGSEDVCYRVAAGIIPPLAQDAAFQKAGAQAEGQDLWGFLSVERLLIALRQARGWDDESKALVAISGLGAVDYAVVTPTDGGLQLSAHLARAEAGVLGLLPETPAQVVRAVPAESAAVVALNWGSGSTFFGGLRDLVVRAAEAAGESDARQNVAALETRLGVTLDKLFAQIGSGAAVWLPAPGEDGLIHYDAITGVLLLADAPGFEDSLRTITLSTVGAPPMDVQVGGTPIKQLMMPPVAYSVLGDRVVIGASPEAVKRYLDWANSTDAKPLMAEPPAAAALLRLDLGYLLTNYPATASGALVQAALAREGDTVRLTAAVEALDQAQLAKAYAKGYLSIMAAMLMPALSTARGEAQKTASKSNLHLIGLAIAMWRYDHGDEYPPTLKDLVESEYLEGMDVFIDPADEDPKPLDEQGLLTSYEYPGFVPKNAPPGLILCYDRQGIHEGGRNVLFVDNAVQWVSEDDLHRPGGLRGMSLKECYDWVMAHGGAELAPERQARLREFYEVEQLTTTTDDNS